MANLNLRTKILFNEKGIEQLPDLLKEANVRNPGILLDQAIADLPLVMKTLSLLEESGCKSFVRISNQPEPTYEWLGTLADDFRKHPLDGMVGIGGGSVLDLSKALAVLMTNPGEPIQYRGFDKPKNKSLYKIAVPTTAGTGSEVTPNASFVESREKVKMGINGECVRADLAILDPRLTLSCPARVTAGSGVDAIVHALEGRIGKKQDLIANVYAEKALVLMFKNLLRAVKEPEDLEARTGLLLGSHLAGIALMTSASGAAAGFSYPLGVHFNVPHGLAGAVYLHEMIRFNVERGYCDGYARIMELIDGTVYVLDSDAKKAKRFSEYVRALWTELKAPLMLNEFGVKEQDISLLHTETLKLRGALNNNPVDLSDGDVRQIIANLVERGHSPCPKSK